MYMCKDTTGYTYCNGNRGYKEPGSSAYQRVDLLRHCICNERVTSMLVKIEADLHDELTTIN